LICSTNLSFGHAEPVEAQTSSIGHAVLFGHGELFGHAEPVEA